MTETFDADGVELRKVREHVWEIPRAGDMRVPARVLASEPLLEEISGDRTLEQLRNTTHLPGIQKHAICMPDGHQGYGFPVGGVAGIDAEEGVISPGAVGYDINCGVRMMRTNLDYEDVRGREDELVDALFDAIPSGLGGGGVIQGDRATVEAFAAVGEALARDDAHRAVVVTGEGHRAFCAGADLKERRGMGDDDRERLHEGLLVLHHQHGHLGHVSAPPARRTRWRGRRSWAARA